MARYINEFQINADTNMIFNEIYSYLMSEGYIYQQFENENVFKKGMGIMCGPSFIKVSLAQNAIRVEAWMKYALLPGVYVGELGLKGFVGAAVKGPLKSRVAQIEYMIQQHGGVPMAGISAYPVR